LNHLLFRPSGFDLGPVSANSLYFAVHHLFYSWTRNSHIPAPDLPRFPVPAAAGRGAGPSAAPNVDGVGGGSSSSSVGPNLINTVITIPVMKICLIRC
jgi:hypothetical protein